MRKTLAIAGTGLTAILLHPLRSLVTVVAVLAVLLPFVVGLAISQGVQEEAEASIRYGADLYISGERLGQRAPLPLKLKKEIEDADVDGILEVVPRIVGGIELGRKPESAVLVGMPVERFPQAIASVEGRLPRMREPYELVFGADLARDLGLEVGSRLLPFHHTARAAKLSVVVGLFRSDVSLWQARVIFTTLETAQKMFNQEGMVSDLLIYCKPEYRAQVRARIVQILGLSVGEDGGLQAKVIAREDLGALLPEGLLHREGIFHLHFVLAFAVGILVVLVTSGLGLSERRREIGILKATGWQTDEILLRGLVESLVLSLAAACLAVLLGYAWLKWLNGYWIAAVFLAGLDAAPSFPIPFRLAPTAALLAFVMAFVVVLTGTLYSSWRAATAPPFAAMR